MPAPPAFETRPAMAWLAPPSRDLGTLSPSVYSSDWSIPLEPATFIVIPPSLTSNGCSTRRPSLIWNAVLIASMVGLFRIWSLVTSTILFIPGKVVQRHVGGLERAPPGERGEERHHVLPQPAVQVEIGGHLAGRVLGDRGQHLHRGERLERGRDVHLDHLEADVERRLGQVGGLVEAAHRDLAAQRVHPEVFQGGPLVLEPNAARAPPASWPF